VDSHGAIRLPRQLPGFQHEFSATEFQLKGLIF
jgi:hypothetical protein